MATPRRSLDRWLAISWALVVVIVLIVRWLDVAAPSRVLSVGMVVAFTIPLAVLSTIEKRMVLDKTLEQSCGLRNRDFVVARLRPEHCCL